MVGTSLTLLCPPYGSVPSRHQADRYAAKIERIPRHLAALGLGRITHLRDVSHLERQPAHQIARALAETEAGIRQLQLRLPARALADSDAQNLPPMLRQSLRIGALHLHA